MLNGWGVHPAAKPSPSICFEHFWLTRTQLSLQNVLLCRTAIRSQAQIQAASLTLPHPGTDPILVYGVEHLADKVGGTPTSRCARQTSERQLYALNISKA